MKIKNSTAYARIQQIPIGRLVWVPKWQWFKPPRWKIFRWAYRYYVVNANRRTYSSDVLENAINNYQKSTDDIWAGEVEHPED